MTCSHTATWYAVDNFIGVEFYVCDLHKGAFTDDELWGYSGEPIVCGFEGEVQADQDDVDYATSIGDSDDKL